MGRWDFKASNLNGSPAEMTNALAAEQVKDIKDINGGEGMLQSTRSESGQDQDLTIYNLSEILQGTPAFSGAANVLGTVQTTLDIGLRGLSKFVGIADVLAFGLIPDDVREAIESAADFVSGDTDAGGSGGDSTLAASSAAKLLGTQGFEGAQGTKAQLEAGQIGTAVISVVQGIVNLGIPVKCISGFRPHSTGSLHQSGRAMDISPVSPAPPLSPKYDEWTRSVYAYLERCGAGKQIDEILGPLSNQFMNQPREGGRGGVDPNGTWWQTNPAHHDHIHIGMRNFDLLAPAPSAAGTNTTPSGLTGTPSNVANPTGPNARISVEDCARLAREAGFKGEALVTIVALAGPESGYRPGRVGDKTIQDATWGPSVGLWQIRTVKKSRGTGDHRDITTMVGDDWTVSGDVDSVTYNMRNQAKNAATISGGGKNFGPWSAYPEKHVPFMAAARAAVAAIGGG